MKITMLSFQNLLKSIVAKKRKKKKNFSDTYLKNFSSYYFFYNSINFHNIKFNVISNIQPNLSNISLYTVKIVLDHGSISSHSIHMPVNQL